MTCSVMSIWEWGAGRMITVYEFCGRTPYTTFPKQWFVVSCVQHVGSWVLSSILAASFSWNITDIYVTWYKVQNCLSICIMIMAVCAGHQIFHSVWQTSCEVTGRFTLYFTFPFLRGTSPFSKIFSCNYTEMFALKGISPSHLNSVPLLLPSENVWRDRTGLDVSVPARFT